MTAAEQADTETFDAAGPVVGEPPPESTEAVDTSWMDAMPTVVLPWWSTATHVAADEASAPPVVDPSWMDALPEAQPTAAMVWLREETERAALSDTKQEPSA